MAQAQRDKKTFTRKLLHKYRLVILNEDTFEERLSFKLTRLNVFILIGISAIILIAMTTVLIAFTPIREYIPGYSSTRLKEQAIRMDATLDSIQRVMNVRSQKYTSVQDLLNESINVETGESNNTTINTPIEELNLTPSTSDSVLRELVAREDKYNLFETAKANANFVLFPPIKGVITAAYDQENKHYAVDVAAEENTPVKAAAEGTVIFAEWTADTGNVIIVKHANNLITVYKHNASLSKSQGDLVRSGEVIAAVGNTGTLSTGPHLHFEVWSNGYPVNPTDFVDFE